MLGVAGAVAVQAKRGSPVRRRSSAVRMQEVSLVVDEEAPPPPPLPKIKTMRVGDQTLAGDMSFDPLEISDTPESLAWYREAEIKTMRVGDQTLAGDMSF